MWRVPSNYSRYCRLGVVLATIAALTTICPPILTNLADPIVTPTDKDGEESVDLQQLYDFIIANDITTPKQFFLLFLADRYNPIRLYVMDKLNGKHKEADLLFFRRIQ